MDGYELDAIAACVVGGVSATGASVRFPGAGRCFDSALLITVDLINVNPYWQMIIKGAIIIFAVALIYSMW